MHRTRIESSTKLPIQRRGTKYVARAASHLNESVSIVLAVRDMLNLARTAKEVKKMVQDKMLKINGRIVEDYRESILLFNILEADKAYELSLLPTKKFTLVPVKNSSQRLCKVVDKRLVKNGLTQLNLHDGTNVLTKSKIVVGDSVYLDMDAKIKDTISIEKGKKVFIISGKYMGHEAKVLSVENNNVNIEVNGGQTTVTKHVVIAR